MNLIGQEAMQMQTELTQLHQWTNISVNEPALIWMTLISTLMLIAPPTLSIVWILMKDREEKLRRQQGIPISGELLRQELDQETYRGQEQRDDQVKGRPKKAA